jgi:hypothetical protein
MGSDRRFLNGQRGGDLAVRQAPRDAPERLALARCQHIELGLIGELGRRLPGHAVDHAPGDRWRQQGLAGGDRVHRRDQLPWSCALDREARGAGAEAPKT